MEPGEQISVTRVPLLIGRLTFTPGFGIYYLFLCLGLSSLLLQHHTGFHEEQRSTHHRGCVQRPSDRPCSFRVGTTAVLASCHF